MKTMTYSKFEKNNLFFTTRVGCWNDGGHLFFADFNSLFEHIRITWDMSIEELKADEDFVDTVNGRDDLFLVHKGTISKEFCRWHNGGDALEFPDLSLVHLEGGAE
tara:strand:+ start:1063 stop:1380 length:318 start_codon:yes stop_codon:yes gene_type:complete